MLKSSIAILTTLLAVSSAFTSPPLRASPTKSTPVQKQPSISDISPRARQPDVIVTKNALREFANWNDVWDGYGGGYGGYGGGGGYGGMRLRR